MEFEKEGQFEKERQISRLRSGSGLAQDTRWTTKSEYPSPSWGPEGEQFG